MAEGATLERLYTGNCIESSNLSVSAKEKTLERLVLQGFFVFCPPQLSSWSGEMEWGNLLIGLLFKHREILFCLLSCYLFIMIMLIGHINSRVVCERTGSFSEFQ